MKRLIGFSLLLVTLSFVGCGGQDKTVSKPENISAPPPATPPADSGLQKGGGGATATAPPP